MGKKLKNDVPNPSSVSNRDVIQRLNFLYQAYKAFDRKYKKNLKALFLVHPTNFIRIVWQLFKPIISIKFGRKMRYVNFLNELEQFMHLEQLLIPKQVLE